MISKSSVLSALAPVAGPDGRTPLGKSGLIAGVSVQDSRVFVAITVTPQEAKTQAAALETMRERIETAAKSVSGVHNVLVTFTAEKAPGSGNAAPSPEHTQGHAHGHSHGHAHAPGQAGGAPQVAALPGVKHVIAVASGKGGVGKSTTAANLAVSLARQGLKVGVLDADIYGPSLPRLFGLKAKPGTDESGKMVPLVNHGCKVMSIGFLVDEETPMVWRGPMVMSALKQLLRDVAWGELDVLVVDMPPGTGDAQLTMAQSVPLSGAVIVSTPQDLALLDARRGIAMFERVSVPILGLIENMSYFVCAHCGTRADIFAHGGARHEAERLKVPFLGEVPLEITIRETSDAGAPIAATAPESPHAKRYADIAAALSQTLALGQAPARSPLRIVIE